MKRFLFTLFLFAFQSAPGFAAEPRILFQDTFDKTLGEGWSWLREESDAWRIENGALEIQVVPGKANTVKNALVRKAPDRSKQNFAVEVTVTFNSKPIEQYEQGGITWYYEKKPVLKLVHEHIDGEEWIVPGHISAPHKTVHLRLLVRGVEWTAQFREALDAPFQTAATGQLPPPGEDEISLQCYDGPAAAEHWIRFDDFRIVELSD